MNIIISTEHDQLFRQFYAAAGSAVSSRRLRNMGLYAFRSLTPEKLLREATGSSGWLWLMFPDNDNRPDWTDVPDRLTTYSSQIMVCAASSDCSTAARLVNSHSMRDVAGYIHPTHDNLKHSCLNILTHLNRHVNSADGFLIVHGSKQETRPPLSSIYYIKTVKGTHICDIRYSDGVYAFYSDIRESSGKLGPPFRQVRASTTANLSNVRSLRPNPDILSFTGGISCCCSRSYRHDLSDYFRGYSSHAHTEKGDGRWKSDSRKTARSTLKRQRISPLPFLSIPS